MHFRPIYFTAEKADHLSHFAFIVLPCVPAILAPAASAPANETLFMLL